MSLIEWLLDRAEHDLAVELFLRNVFMSIPAYLKTCRLVSSKWNAFIKSRIWANQACRRYLEWKLMRNWQLGVPLKKQRVKESCFDVDRIAMDDHILLVSGGGGNIYVYDVETGERITRVTHYIETDQFSSILEDDIEAKFCITQNYFVSAISQGSPWIQVWSKRGNFLEKVKISPSPRYIRIVKAVDQMIFVCDTNNYPVDNKIFVFKYECGSVHSLYNVYDSSPLGPGSYGSIRDIDSDGHTLFVSSHDVFVKIWDVESGQMIKYIKTGLVVKLLLKSSLIITVGSIQNQGVKFWDLVTGSKLLELHNDTYFEQIILSHNQIFVRGLDCFRIPINVDDFSASETKSWKWYNEWHRTDLVGMNRTKIITVEQERYHKNKGVQICLTDFWSK